MKMKKNDKKIILKRTENSSKPVTLFSTFNCMRVIKIS